MDPYFFLTDKSTNYLYLCLLNPEKNSYERIHYFPIKFEKFTGHQIERYQRTFVRKFLWFSIFNKSKFENPIDYRIAICRIYDFNTDVIMMGISGIFFYKLLENFKAPFLELALANIMTLKNFRKSIAFSIFITGTIFSWRKITGQTYLFDLALKYKEFIAPEELISPNCEGIWKEQKKLMKEKKNN